METVGSYEAKTHLPRLLRKVIDGETVTITKHGIPIARLIPYSSEVQRDRKKLIEDFIAYRKSLPRHKGKFNIREAIEEGRM